MPATLEKPMRHGGFETTMGCYVDRHAHELAEELYRAHEQRPAGTAFGTVDDSREMPAVAEIDINHDNATTSNP